ncbi:MAG: (d)CMP kinase [Prevotellaceae bacterium]|jgi:cytidylate kinase|nr:(d)CMP kinase [Prevotellaceae bacterium]
MKKIIIAIDGYSSCGKSTFAKAIAAKLGYTFIDSGAMYRAVTLFAIRNEFINPGGSVKKQELIAALPQIHIRLAHSTQSGKSEAFLNDENVEREIRLGEVSDKVSRVSEIGEVRGRMVALQQEMGGQKAIVMDGRDIGTVVFPQAELKIFMTADPVIRAQRRYKELTAKGEPVNLADIEKNIRERDRIDEYRAVSPLRKAADAIVLDNSHLTVEQQMQWVMDLITEKTK